MNEAKIVEEIIKHLPMRHDQMSHAGAKGAGSGKPLSESTAGFEVKGSDGELYVRVPHPGALMPGTKEFDAAVGKKVNEHNRYPGVEPSGGVFSFNTSMEAIAWLDEYSGQISDGKYENSSGTQWEFFASLKIKIDPKQPTQIEADYIPKHRKFNFKDLKWLASSDNVYSGDIARPAMSHLTNDQLDALNDSVVAALR